MRDPRVPRSSASAPDPEAAEEAARLARSLAQVEVLYKSGRLREALAACRPLATRYPREPRVLGLLGLLYARMGDVHQALLNLTDALAVAPQHPVEILTHLAFLYAQADAPMHALQTWRSLQQRHYARVPRPPHLPDPAAPIESLTQQVRATPGLAGLPPEQIEPVLLAAERGHLRLLSQAGLRKIETECRAAMRLAPQYPAPYLTLARALFFEGQVPAAIATLAPLAVSTASGARSGSVPAALAFYHYWAGAPLDECRALLAASEVDPMALAPAEAMALATAWGLLGDDAAVLRLLAPLAPAVPPEDATLPAPHPALSTPPSALSTRLLATAHANSGQVDAALELLRPWRAEPDARLQSLITALEHEATVPASGERYAYVTWDEVLPATTLRRFTNPAPPPRWPFIWRTPAPPPGPLRDRLLAAYPRLGEIGALMLASGDAAVEVLGIRLLKLLATPDANRVLGAHLRGKAGSYAGRQDAGYALVDLAALPNGTMVPFWTGTDWAEIRFYRLTPGGIYPARQESELVAQLAVVEGTGAEARPR